MNSKTESDYSLYSIIQKKTEHYSFTIKDNKKINELLQNIRDINELKNMDGKNDVKLLLKKINSSRSGYNSRNKKKKKENEENNKNNNELKNYICSFIGFYRDNDEDLKKIIYADCFEYKLDIKIDRLNSKSAKLLTDYCILNAQENSYFFEDIKNNKMKKYIAENEQNLILYFLKIHASPRIVDILGDSIKITNDIMSKLMSEHIKRISTYILGKNYINIAREIELEMNIIKNYIKYFKETEFRKNKVGSEWIKSKGELIALFILLLIFNNNVNLNINGITNPLTNKKLEFDFYISNNDLVIEINGKYHENKDQKNRDIIKNIVCKESNITLISIEWKNDSKSELDKFIDILYNNLKSFLEKNGKPLEYSCETIKEIYKNLETRIKTYKYTYEIDYYDNFP